MSVVNYLQAGYASKGRTLKTNFSNIACFPSLYKAFTRARKANRWSIECLAFHRDLELQILGIEEALLRSTWKPSGYRYFYLKKTKKRLVSSTRFIDRVVHHSLVAELERVWESEFIEHSYACRRQKGSHAAIRQAQKLCRKYRYALRLDVEKFFESIDHEILCKILLARNDDMTQRLCTSIISASKIPTVAHSENRGIPIGSLCSQFFANLYLHSLDIYLLQHWPSLAYIRYMDDIWIGSDSKVELWS